MNETVKATLSGLPREFLEWLETLRNKNPLVGTKDGTNTNGVFVAIGRNLVVDEILKARENAIHPKQQPFEIHGSDVIMGVSKE